MARKPRFYSREEMIAEARRIAGLFGTEALKCRDFQKHSAMCFHTCCNHFGSWNKFVEAAGLVPRMMKLYKRLHIPLRIVLNVLKRDNCKCFLCNASPANDIMVELQVDHIKPVSMGGSNDMDNLWTLCKKCNRLKGDNYDINIRLEAFKHKLVCELQKEIKDNIKYQTCKGHVLPNRSVCLTKEVCQPVFASLEEVEDLIDVPGESSD